MQRGITNRHEGLGVHAGLGDPNGVDGKDSHLIEDALDHVGGLVGVEKAEEMPAAFQGADFFLSIHNLMATLSHTNHDLTSCLEKVSVSWEPSKIFPFAQLLAT